MTSPTAAPEVAGPLDTGPLDTGPLDTGPLEGGPPEDGQAAPAAGSALVTVTPGRLWRASRGPLAVALAIGLAILVMALIGHAPTSGRLDPESAGGDGGRALAELLRDRGVDVQRTRGLPGDPRGTVLITDARSLTDADLARLTGLVTVSHVVLIDPGPLTVLGERVEVVGDEDVRQRVPGCDLAVAATAGAVEIGGTTYSVDADADTCYAAAGRPTLVQLRRAAVTVTLVGTGEPFTNDRLDEEGNAALALGLLSGSEPQVLHWVLPPPLGSAGAAGGDESVDEVLPDRIDWLEWQLLVAGALAALWRGRRLGPVVAERLPVVVRAAEAVEGRARLYAAGRARGRAAELLRAGTRDRLVRALALSPDSSSEAVIHSIGARTRRGVQAVGDLLYGPPPPDDESLVRLATELDTLDSEVRRT